MSSKPDFIPAAEVLDLLGIRPQTLYAYVSRGWLRSIKQPGRREHLYARDDVERLRARSRARLGHGAVAAGAMHWGDPIIATSITEITSLGPRYRTYLAVDLARGGHSFETAAELLWSGLHPEEPVQWPVDPLPPAVTGLTRSIAVGSNEHLLEVFSVFVLALGMTRGTFAERLRGGSPLAAAREILQTLAGCLGYASERRCFVALRDGEGFAAGVARAFGIEPSEENCAALDAILILLADHELAPTTFAARVAASSGAALHSCIASALCTTAGTQTGRIYDRVEDMLRGATTRAELLDRAREMNERGSTPPGFSHPFYPKGDPRALHLFDLAGRRSCQSRQLEGILGFIEGAGAELDLHPRQELAVATLAIVMGLPEHCGSALYALARTAGWVAHVVEQRLAGTLLRPRARFVGAAVPVS
ncbi:MAG: citrate/2-methylcitrate synthase [Deferrisomatales bacterium]|nr:citrate/2-methylcitrate synthase [Deferrisomatales bacterium]